MTLTVGTDAHDALANVDAYHAARANAAWAAVADDTTREVYIRQATDYLERSFVFRGTRETSAQRLHFPALYAVDDDGHAIGATGQPWQLQEACAIVADLFRVGTYNLTGIVTDDLAAIKREKIDVIETEYDNAHRLRGADVLSHVIKLLRPVTRERGLMRA